MKEKSCGAIVYKEENKELKFLLVHQSNGHYSFPKGHTEEGESELETTLREVKEETNLDVEVDTNFRCEITYLVEPKNVIKDAVYYVATPTSFDLKNQEGEITESGWYDYQTALDKLEFDNIKEVFRKGYDYIKNQK